MNTYWQDRAAAAQAAFTKKNTKQIEKQLVNYYSRATDKVVKEFESTYNKLLATVGKGKQATPADLYKLDKYWNLQGQLRQELEKLGNKQITLLNKKFELQFFDVYYSIDVEGLKAFSTIDRQGALQIINSIWCADGKSWSQRIWDNTQSLMETLNDGLLHTVITGKKSGELKKILQERFNVSFRQADTLVRTELAHIQTESAKKRYENYGIQEVQIWADEDERRCPECGKLHEKRYSVGAAVPIPAHPNCRCCIIPVVEI